MTLSGSGAEGLAIRCLEGRISLLLISGRSNASAGDSTKLKIVADAMPVRGEEEAAVLGVSNFGTAVVFGDESTLAYLKGAQKISVRYNLASAILNESFSGGESLADVIPKALLRQVKMPADASASFPLKPAPERRHPDLRRPLNHYEACTGRERPKSD